MWTQREASFSLNCAWRRYLWQLTPHLHKSCFLLSQRRCFSSFLVPDFTSCTFMLKRKISERSQKQLLTIENVYSLQVSWYEVKTAVRKIRPLGIVEITSVHAFSLWWHPLEFNDLYHLSYSHMSNGHFSTPLCFIVHKKWWQKLRPQIFTSLLLSSENRLTVAKKLTVWMLFQLMAEIFSTHPGHFPNRP